MTRQLVVGLFALGLVTTGCLVCAKPARTDASNHVLSNGEHNPKGNVIADGNPPPPFPPIKKPRVAVAGSSTQYTTPERLTADGNPPPPFPWFTADGNPPPPFPRPLPPGPRLLARPSQSELAPWLLADGNPPPPFPPRPPTQSSPIV
jgi:hypothetical protein